MMRKITVSVEACFPGYVSLSLEGDGVDKLAESGELERMIAEMVGKRDLSAETNSAGEARCGVVGWPPLKKAIWDQVIDANINSGEYLSAWDLTDNIYAAALSSPALS